MSITIGKKLCNFITKSDREQFYFEKSSFINYSQYLSEAMAFYKQNNDSAIVNYEKLSLELQIKQKLDQPKARKYYY